MSSPTLAKQILLGLVMVWASSGSVGTNCGIQRCDESVTEKGALTQELYVIIEESRSRPHIREDYPRGAIKIQYKCMIGKIWRVFIGKRNYFGQYSIFIA